MNKQVIEQELDGQTYFLVPEEYYKELKRTHDVVFEINVRDRVVKKSREERRTEWGCAALIVLAIMVLVIVIAVFNQPEI